MESFKEFCEGWVGMKGNVWQRNELFSEKSLQEQYDQLIKAIECNQKMGTIKIEG